jgi:hypothetical protein
MDCNVIVTCLEKESLFANRNYGLKQCKAPVVIMMDDGASGFYRGWWRELITPMEDPRVVLCAPRLIAPDGVVISIPYSDNSLAEPVEYVQSVPLCFVAIRNSGVLFDERGSDRDFVGSQCAKRQDAAIAISNQCKMVYGRKIVVSAGDIDGGFKKPKGIVVT